MTSDHPITLSSDVLISSVSPLDVWIAIKTVLRRELGELEWEMWIQHARLWRVMGGDTLGVLVPRNGKAAYGSLRHMRRVRRLGARMGFGVMLTVAHDPGYQQIQREAIVAMDEDDPRKWQLQLKWETQQAWLAVPFLEAPCSPLWEGQ